MFVDAWTHANEEMCLNNCEQRGCIDGKTTMQYYFTVWVFWWEKEEDTVE